jgi:hypothetical protein
MRSYKEILSYLLIREQLSLGWMIGFFIVCGALLYGSLVLSRIQIRSLDVLGTVIGDRVDQKKNIAVNYLTVELDNGDTVRAITDGKTDYRPGERVIIKETSANFFGARRHELKKYLNESHHK